MLRNLNRRHTGYPHTMERCLDGSACRVTCEPRPGFSDNGFAVALITPGQVGEPLEGDAVKLRQVLGPLRRSKPFKEGGTGAGDGSDHPDLRRDQCRILKDAEPECNMDLLLDEVDAAVCEEDPHVDLRVRFEELDDDGQGELLAEGDWERDRKFSPRLAVFPGCCLLGLLQLFDDAPGRCHIVAAGVGELQPSARPYHKAGPQVGLKVGNLPADGRERRAQAARARREAAFLQACEEDSHGVETIHQDSHRMIGGVSYLQDTLNPRKGLASLHQPKQPGAEARTNRRAAVTIPVSTLVDQLAHAKKGEEPVDRVMKAPEKVAEAPQTIDR